MQIRAAIDGYLFASEAENKSAKTLSTLRWHLGKFTDWKGDIQLAEIDPNDVRGFLVYQQKRGLAPHSVHQYYKVLRGFFNWCLVENILEADPLRSVKPPKLPELLPKVLLFGQIEQLLKLLHTQTSLVGRRNYLMVLTFLTCGLRANELCQLEVGEVRLENQFLIVRHGKGSKQRAVPLRPMLRKQLWRYLTEWRAQFEPQSDHLFLTDEGHSIPSLTIERIIRRLLVKIGVRGGTQILRYTMATLYLQSGGDIERLRLILGHTSLTVTQRYVHLSTTDLIWRPGMPTPLDKLGL